MERLDDDKSCEGHCAGRCEERSGTPWRVIEGGGSAQDAARPILEDYGLTPEDLRIWYSPGRAGAVLGVLATLGMGWTEAVGGARHSDPWFFGALSGLLYGGLIGGFGGLGLLVLVHWCDPLVGMVWPQYARLRRYREALAAARAADADLNERPGS